MGLFSPSTTIDQVWHAHLSFVDRYQYDVRALCDGQLIEHSPVLGEEAFKRYETAYRMHVSRMKKAGVKVDATGNEKILYSIFSFLLVSSSSNDGVSFTLKASEIVGVYGFTTFTTSVPMFSSFFCEKTIWAIIKTTSKALYFDLNFILIDFEMKEK